MRTLMVGIVLMITLSSQGSFAATFYPLFPNTLNHSAAATATGITAASSLLAYPASRTLQFGVFSRSTGVAADLPGSVTSLVSGVANFVAFGTSPNGCELHGVLSGGDYQGVPNCNGVSTGTAVTVRIKSGTGTCPASQALSGGSQFSFNDNQNNALGVTDGTYVIAWINRNNAGLGNSILSAYYGENSAAGASLFCGQKSGGVFSTAHVTPSV